MRRYIVDRWQVMDGAETMRGTVTLDNLGGWCVDVPGETLPVMVVACINAARRIAEDDGCIGERELYGLRHPQTGEALRWGGQGGQAYLSHDPVTDDEYQGRWYVNVYTEAQIYGGPEEGGWWYPAGEPCDGDRVLACLPNDERAFFACVLGVYGVGRPALTLDAAYEIAGWLREHSKALDALRESHGGERVLVLTERHEGRSYPARRPIYC